MPFENPGNDRLREILSTARTIAVIGLSDNPERESYTVSASMQARGYRILPVNPNVESVLGQRAYVSVTDIKEPIDIINVFRKSEALPTVMADAVKSSAPVIWCQEGVYNEDAADIAEAAGKEVIMDRCIAVMHSILVGHKH